MLSYRTPLFLSKSDGKIYCIRTNKFDVIDPITKEIVYEGELPYEVYNKENNNE